MQLKNAIKQYEEQGCAVIENFLTAAEVDELKAEIDKLIKKMPDAAERIVYDAKVNAFTTGDGKDKNDYYLESGYKMHYFFEKDALGPKGELKIDPRLALFKIGHCVHPYDAVFQKYTFDNRVKETLRELGYEDPAVVQSMYIFKNPSIGSEVVSHKDATYIITEPSKVVGLWIAMDDATTENGCLWYIKGSHKIPAERLWILNPDKNSKQKVIYDKPAINYDMSEFTPQPVKKGDCVLIHGNVVHYSAPNKSKNSRHAYTFHVMETKNTKYSEKNWLQLPKGQDFWHLNQH